MATPQAISSGDSRESEIGPAEPTEQHGAVTHLDRQPNSGVPPVNGAAPPAPGSGVDSHPHPNEHLPASEANSVREPISQRTSIQSEATLGTSVNSPSTPPPGVTASPQADQPPGPPADRPTPLADQPTSGTVSPQADPPAGGTVTPLADQPTSGTVSPQADPPAGGTVTPLADQPTGGTVPPPADQPTGGTVSPEADPSTGSTVTPQIELAVAESQPSTDANIHKEDTFQTPIQETGDGENTDDVYYDARSELGSEGKKTVPKDKESKDTDKKEGSPSRKPQKKIAPTTPDLSVAPLQMPLKGAKQFSSLPKIKSETTTKGDAGTSVDVAAKGTNGDAGTSVDDAAQVTSGGGGGGSEAGDYGACGGDGGGGASEGGGAGGARTEPDMVAYKKPAQEGNFIDPKDPNKKNGSGKEVFAAITQALSTRKKYNFQNHICPNKDVNVPVPKGLTAAQEKSIAVAFHCIVPKPMWLWDEHSCIHMRFEGHDLGNWQQNIGHFVEKRCNDEGYSEMECTLVLAAELFKDPLVYKYVIYSPKVTKESEYYEKLHPFIYWPGTDPNRCLVLSHEEQMCAYGGIFHQHDYIVYPQEMKLPASFFDQFKDTVMNFFRGKSSRSSVTSDVEINVPTLNSMVMQSFLFYLEVYKTILLGCDLQGIDFVRCFNQITVIFKQHRQAIIRIWRSVHRESIHGIVKGMKNWLEQVIETLAKAENPTQQFVSSVLITCCIHQCLTSHNLKKEFVMRLLNMLSLSTGIQEKVSYLMDIIPVQYRPTVSSAFSKLFKDAMGYSGTAVLDWLYVVPLYHFMNGDCKPYMKLECSPKIGARAENPELNLKQFKRNIPLGFVKEHYNSLEQLFVADPLLLHDFIYLTRPDDYVNLFQKIPTHLSLACLLSLAFELWNFNIDDGEKWLEWLTIINRKITHQNLEESEYTVDAALSLVVNLFRKLTHHYAHIRNVLKMAVTVLLFSLAKIKEHVTQEKFYEVFSWCEQCLKDWVVNATVIGGSCFGGSKRGREELEVWESFLSMETPDDCEIAEKWNKALTKVITKRVQQTPVEAMLNLIPLIKDNTHSALSSLLMEGGIEAIDQISSNPRKYSNQSKDLAKFATLESKKVGVLFEHLLKRKYPDICHEESINLSLEDLLTWPHWPSFIRIYKARPVLLSALPQPCQFACSLAFSKLQDIIDQLHTGDISIVELNMIKRAQDAMKLLCEAANEGGNGRLAPSSDTEWKPALTKRLQEYDEFQKQNSFLLHLCQQVSRQVLGVKEAMEELQIDYTNYKINNLCVRKQEGIDVICFTIASPLRSFAWKFNVMVKEKNSSLFINTWHDKVRRALTQHLQLNLSEIEKEVWMPTIQHCQTLLSQLEHMSIELCDVKHLLESGYTLERELKALSLGISICTGRQCSDKWIPASVNCIQEYCKLCDYGAAAKLFLTLRNSLQLEGDFGDVESIAAEISVSMTDQKLSDINDDLIAAGKFLSEFTGDKLTCIGVFCKCQELVQWIRDTTKDVSDLQKFVNVALTTAAGGEGDLTNDRLSSLRRVGSGFSSLIYDLGPHSGSRELRTKCSIVWDAYKNDKKLPQMLESCNNDLEWYKSVKETQASVEVTSYGQMDNIHNFGRYFIGGKGNVAMDTFHDVVHLTLKPGKEKELLKTSYNLDELRDLESKIVLITGSKAENRAEVDQFLNTFHSVCRIAEVLIKLQQAGNVQYIGWRMEFYCQTLLVEHLQLQAKKMEDELEMWDKEVILARNNFYELNYYTAHQLLVLRSELGRLKIVRQSSKQVMSLLGSISSAITLTTVTNIVQQVVNTPLEDLETDICSPFEEELSSEIPSESSPNPADQLAIIIPEAVTSLPHVGLSQEDLNIEQRAHFMNIKQKFGYSEIVILKAIRAVNGGDFNDILNWLAENVDEWDEASQEAEETGTSESENDTDDPQSEEDEQTEFGSEAESEIENIQSAVSGQSLHSVSSPSSSQPQSRVVVTRRQHVDETNSDVQELLDAGMGTVEECIQAIEVYGTANMAFNHMMELQEKTTVSEDTPLPLFSVSEGLTMPVLPHQPVTKTDKVVISVKDVKDQFLKLKELGAVLKKLSEKFPGTVQQTRSLLSDLKRGQPHLLVVPPDQVLRAALSLYMEDSRLPLPTPEEMLICNQNTTSEEVNLLWQRAVCDPDFKRIFCLVHAEKLSYQTADIALRALTEIIQHKAGYSLVIICSSLDEDKSLIISKLHLYRRPYGVPDTDKCRQYLEKHFVKKDLPSYQQVQEMQKVDCPSASVVDPKRSCVRVVSSSRAGMGKTLFVIRMAEKLQAVIPGHNTLITIPVHGPVVTIDSIMESVVPHENRSECTILHFDISPSVLWQVDTILFSLLVQGGLCDSQGRVWRNHPTQLYAIEVTTPERCENKSIPEHLTLQVLEMLPTVTCVTPKIALSLMSRDETDLRDRIAMDEKEFKNETLQRVYQYLRRHAAGNNLDLFSYKSGIIEGTPQDCLEICHKYCGVKDPSWAEIGHFVKFLDLQLRSCERSYFTNPEFVGDVMTGFKGFVVKLMIQMSRDFSTSSLSGEVAQENDEADGGQDVLHQYQIVERKKWEHSSHPYLFFNQDGMSFTFVGFVVTVNGDLWDPAHPGVILEKGIMTQQLYTGLKAQRVNFNEDYRQWPKNVMIQKISTVMGIEWPHDPDPTYVLTVDNLIKILAIQMRFRCSIPVVIMGETGCGKTRLIRFMCNLASQGSGQRNMLILKVHGGTTDEDIVAFVRKAKETAKENRSKNLDTVVFFDEANTTDAIGLIKEIMCDRRVHGNPVSQDLKFIAACNPYRRHTEEMIKKLRSAGLGFYVRETDTQQKLGKIPLRELVYRVIDLPPSMRPLVYDFGQLNTDTERDYTIQIVHDHVKKHAVLSQQNCSIITAIAHVLAWSQKYMRDRKDECSFVSLRDVERAMIVFIYFFEKMAVLRDPINKKKMKEDAEMNAQVQLAEGPILAPVAVASSTVATDLTRSLILSLSVCYHARLSDRKEYERKVAHEFTAPLVLSGGMTEFRNVIRWSQEVLLESMVLGENIARNTALRENVFMMAVCLDLRIPLFLVGKPGSSKSLAKAIVADSMRGQASQNDLLKSFKQVHMFSYQCSQLSTPQSVIEVFNTAKRFQRNQDTTKYVSVVVLDEVGLAEDSPNLPLKALHPLLEDGTEGSEDRDEVVAREKRVAFIGISNWALDPAKMNRGVMVTRGDPDIDELVLSAQGICHSDKSDAVKDRLNDYFRVLAKAYHEICENQNRQFFGLRDFYSLIKMLYWMCEKTNMPPTGPQLVHAIKRNFGGLEESGVDPETVFLSRLRINIDEAPDLSDIDPEVREFVSPDNTQRGLIKTSLKTKETSWHGENRYLLFLTENYAALEILKQYLQDQEGGHPLLSLQSVESSMKPWEMEPFVLFGSSFPKDKEYTQVCRNINQIKICMEIGRTVILLNLENLYESLYDVLNQYYIHHGGNRYVDLGLQTHKVKCRVHDEFKLILIAEKTTVYNEFPTPLINRLEKHFVLYSSVLEDWQTDVLDQMEQWIEAFSRVQSSNARFKEGDAFVGYQKDVAAAVVFQASSQLRKTCERLKGETTGRQQLWETAWRDGLLGDCSLEQLAEEDEGSHNWKEAVNAKV
jgi:hypothetical protein